MSSQKIVDLVMGIRKAVKRGADETDSDDSIDLISNRGNKLRKKARYVREGQLAPLGGSKACKKMITFGDEQYSREIISRNPVLYDEDGDEVDIEDDDERAHAAAAAASEFYPYADVKIEHLLAPLTAATGLPTHPTLSKPFTSKTLTELTRNARDMVQKERAALWRMKHLLTKLSGDHTWIPCEMMETEHDIALFEDGLEAYREHLLLKAPSKDEEMPTQSSIAGNEVRGAAPIIGDGPAEMDALKNQDPELEDVAAQGDVTMMDAPDTEVAANSTTGDTNTAVAENLTDIDTATATGNDDSNEGEATIDPDETLIEEDDEDTDDKPQTSMENGEKVPVDQEGQVEESEKVLDDEASNGDEDELEGEGEPATHRMRTRAQAQAASDNNTVRTRSMSPESNESYIHPYFLAPRSARPDRDLGLPPGEADETRKLLQLYIQKQEEVCRGADKVYNGLLKAERLRKTVMMWTKYEEHQKEMSDGEDWYDKDEWNLTEDLKKGQDEDEEDAVTTQKKTRTRRQ